MPVYQLVMKHFHYYLCYQLKGGGMEIFMNIQKNILFHISPKNIWKIGDTIIAGKQENPFWLACKNYSPRIEVNEETISMFTMFDKYPQLDLTQDTLNYIYQLLKNVSKEMAFYIREQVFEDVRKEFYPKLPSRQKCLWLSDEDGLSYWRTMTIGEQQYLLTLELDGNIFCGDEYWLKADTLSSIEYANRAKHYWSGDMTNRSVKEYLFYGQAIIKDIIQLE